MANYKDIRYNFALPSNAAVGSMTLIKTVTASSDGTIDFLNGSSDVVLDNTYPIYVFKFINIHPASDSAEFSFQADTGTNTSYNQTITSTFFKGQHRQDAAVSGLSYDTGADLAQSTNFQRLGFNLDNSNEDSFSGTLTIFEPYSSTFVKHFISTNNYTYDGDANEQYSFNTFVAGYFNTTTALTRFRFKMESGNIDAGTFKLYGIKN
jgi:hypothetical protein